MGSSVVVVGCGPAGSTAAYVLANAGIRVTAIDRYEFPRPKLCGGLITRKTVELIDEVYGSVECLVRDEKIFKSTSSGYKLFHRKKQLCDCTCDYPFYFVDRSGYDNYFLGQAKAKGVEVLEGSKVKDVDFRGGRVETSGGKFIDCDFIIAADGANSLIRKKLEKTYVRLKKKWEENLAIAVECMVSQNELRERIDVPHVYFGYTQWGYAWAFPHGHDVVLGIGSLVKRSGSRIKRQFGVFLDELGIAANLRSNLKGHPVPYGYHLPNPTEERCLLVGDAAGFVDSLYGEGIFFSHYSGYLAAKSILLHCSNNTKVNEEYVRLVCSHIDPYLKKRKKQRQKLFRSLEFMGHWPIRVAVVFGKKWMVNDVHGRLSAFGGIE
jgi:geranylgeranyl reductase family protein